jgi:hypothetical protein
MLLEEIGHDDGNPNRWPSGKRLAEDTEGMLLRRGLHLPPIRSIAELQAIHDAEIVRENAARRARGPRRCVFADDGNPAPRVVPAEVHLPPAPVRDVVGAIEYLATQDALSDEGVAMHNCVSGYGRQVASGRVFIYRVLAPERCTLAIALDPSGHFKIDQLCGPCNARPRLSDTHRLIEQWLRDNHDESAVNSVRTLQEIGDPVRLVHRGGGEPHAEQEAACPF